MSNIGYIYAIASCDQSDDNDVYYGATTEKINLRFARHKNTYYRWRYLAKPKYMMSCDIFMKYGVETCEIFLLEKMFFDDKKELFMRETEYIKANPCVNARYRCTDSGERAERRKEAANRYARTHGKDQKIYYKNNRERILAKRAVVKMCTCGRQYTHGNRLRHTRSQFHIDNQQIN